MYPYCAARYSNITHHVSLLCCLVWSFNSLCIPTRVSSETSFASKQPKMEPKLVSALSKTKGLFWLFWFFTETASFGVSIEPKQKKINQNKPKCDFFSFCEIFFVSEGPYGLICYANNLKFVQLLNHIVLYNL